MTTKPGRLQREIKFRAWDTFQKKYVFVGFHVVGEVTAFGGIDSIVRETYKARGKSFIEAYCDFILEQFACVTDKNGADVYEGDLMAHDDNSGKAWPVVFKGGRFGLAFDNGYVRSIPARKTMIVVGNINEGLALSRSTGREGKSRRKS